MTTNALAHFHRTGDRLPDLSDPPAGLRPALLARYLDLASLRHDYPLVLVDDVEEPVRTLTATVNELLCRIAPEGAAGERLRQHVLRAEAAIRRSVPEDGTTTLAAAWDAAQEALTAADDDPHLVASLDSARSALEVDGRLVACVARGAVDVMQHLLALAQRPRLATVRAELGDLRRRLYDILEADDRRSPTGRGPDRLRTAVGTTHADDFDFDAWSEVLASRPYEGAISESRRARIEWAIDAIETQRFFDTTDRSGEVHGFAFDGCARAAEAYDARMPELLRLAKAMAIARLELDNAYDEAAHDGFFHAFDGSVLEPEDLTPFPAYLVIVDADALDSAERARILELLASAPPIKVVVLTSDVLGSSNLDESVGIRGLTGVELTQGALGLGTAQVVQTTVAGLARMAAPIAAALSAPGPALISVGTGAAGADDDLPLYLSAAAATEARALVSLVFDPRAGSDWTEQVRLPDNPQPADDWPLHRLVYEDEDLQRVEVDVAFTYADLLAADPRAQRHVAVAPRETWNGELVQVADYLRMEPEDREAHVPYVLMVGDDDVLRRVVVDQRIVEATQRRRDAWRHLQGLAGTRESHERRLLEAERVRLAAERDLPAPSDAAATLEVDTSGATAGVPPAPAPQPTAEQDAASPAPPDEATPEVADLPPPGEAWIETSRCTTCDECTNLNPRMFAYDDNKQAHIVDLQAGTFRDLVEAAENCQVAIIHPGEPWDPGEPGLDDLRRRAAAFA